MAGPGLVTRIPLWVRVPGIVALVLAGVLVSALLLNAARDGSGHHAGNQTRTDGSGHGAGHDSRGGGHGSGGNHESR
jgi:hypothetical protein